MSDHHDGTISGGKQDKHISYKKAREMTLWIWDRARRTGKKPTESEFIEKWGLFPKSGCGFCQYYQNDCNRCPMKWENPMEEQCSGYQTGNPFYCLRSYWKWNDWRFRIGKDPKAIRMAKHWAGKIYLEVLDSPEEEPVVPTDKDQIAKREQMLKSWYEKQRDIARKIEKEHLGIE